MHLLIQPDPCAVNQHVLLWNHSSVSTIALFSKCLTPHVRHDAGADTVPLGMHPPPDSFTGFRADQECVFFHCHMPYGVEHMVVAHLTNTC